MNSWATLDLKDWTMDSFMNNEILFIAEQLKEVYQGDPWFGRSVMDILGEVDESIAFEKPGGQHSILDLVWHMITWKEFTISRIRKSEDKPLHYFEEQDWRELDHSDKTLWKKGLQHFTQLHNELVEILQQQKDDLLSQNVAGRTYDFRKLLEGIVQHDIYHLGQIAYIKKQLKK
jgi:uncharacterized damage-inducible protein DinB